MKERSSVIVACIVLFFVVFVTCAYSDTRSEAQEHRKKAAEYFQKREIDKALEHLMKAIEYSDTSSSTYALVGTMYKLKGMKSEALEYYETALAVAERELVFAHALVPKPEEDVEQVQRKIDEFIADREYNGTLIKKSIADLEE